MKEITPEIKRQQWGEGPWVDEPDSYLFEYEGYECAVFRIMTWEGYAGDHLSLGHLCGYVKIPEDHPWYNLDYNDIEADVHGGITFFGVYDEPDLEDSVYSRIGIEGKWIGFDCSHYSDLTPSYESILSEFQEKVYEKLGLKDVKKDFPELLHRTYKDINFVIEETKSLAHQAKEAENDS